MRTSTKKLSFLAGALVANSGPHLAVAVTGHRELTPLAGRDSSSAVNAVWGLANLVGGLTLLRRVAGAPSSRWKESFQWFEIGAAGFATWMAVSELVLPVSSSGGAGVAPTR